MDLQAWRVVVVRAWPERDRITAVVLVAKPDEPLVAHRATVGSAEVACTVVASVLAELTTDAPSPETDD